MSQINQYDISIVIPVFNEEENLYNLHSEITTILDTTSFTYEIIYVNDGSTDASVEVLTTITHDDYRTRSILLRRNFGQTAAMAAGADHSRGEVIVFMDADLQNDPADISKLWREIQNGYDVVSGWRYNRQDRLLTRRAPSIIANKVISLVTGIELHDYGCTLKAYRRDVFQEIRLYGEMHRFIPVFAAASGAAIIEVKVNHRPRLKGRSKYGLGRTFKVMLDLITVKFLLSYRTTPMYLFGGIGSFFILGGFLSVTAALINKFVSGVSLIRTPLTLLGATLAGLGVQSILLGLVSELLLRTYYEAQNKTPYIIRQIIDNETKHSL